MPVRIQFQEELARIEASALQSLELVIEQLERVLEALEHRDMELAQLVIADDDRLDGRYLELHQAILTLLATQAPVATDLRLVSALLHALKCMERMGDQCVNIAKLIPVAGHDAPTNDQMLSNMRTMGDQAKALISQARRSFAEREPQIARDLARQDDVIDQLNRDCFRIAIEIGDDPDAREWAMTMILCARAIERIGDNAVDIGEQVCFLVTGQFEEFEDASHVAGA